MTQLNHTNRARTPKNSVGGGCIPLRLSPEERTAIDAMAEAECRSASNMARIIFLRGLEAMKPESAAATGS